MASAACTLRGSGPASECANSRSLHESSRARAMASAGDTSAPAATMMELRVENTVLRADVQRLTEENQRLRMSMTKLASDAEAEEEAITNTLLKRLEALKEEKTQLVLAVDREEEFLTNTLQKKLAAVLKEKQDVENKLEAEQEYLVNKLQRQLTAVQREKEELEEALCATRDSNFGLQQKLEEERAARAQLAESAAKLTSDLEVGEERSFHSRSRGSSVDEILTSPAARLGLPLSASAPAAAAGTTGTVPSAGTAPKVSVVLPRPRAGSDHILPSPEVSPARRVRANTPALTLSELPQSMGRSSSFSRTLGESPSPPGSTTHHPTELTSGGRPSSAASTSSMHSLSSSASSGMGGTSTVRPSATKDTFS